MSKFDNAAYVYEFNRAGYTFPEKDFSDIAEKVLLKLIQLGYENIKVVTEDGFITISYDLC